MRDLSEIIRTLQQDIESRNVLPAIVPLKDFLRVVTEETKKDLWELVKKGKVNMHETLNGYSFSVPCKKGNSDENG